MGISRSKIKMAVLAVLGVVLIGLLIKGGGKAISDLNSLDRVLPDAGTDTVGVLSNNLNSVDSTELKYVKDLTLNENNSVSLIGEVSLSSVSLAISQLKERQATEGELYLIITSPGGSVFAGAMLMETIQNSPIPINTVCVAFCASMGAHIHQMGKKRYMTDRSTLMFHPASGGVQGEMETVQSRVQYVVGFVNKMDAFVAQRAKLSLRDFKALVRNELWLDSRDATERKFNDAIVYLIDSRTSLGSSNSESEEGKGLGEDKLFNFR